LGCPSMIRPAVFLVLCWILFAGVLLGLFGQSSAGISPKPSVKPAASKPPGPPPDCSGPQSCTPCVSIDGCGWCEVTEECLPGDVNGPGGNPANCSDWQFVTCLPEECNMLSPFGCERCVKDPFCGWCSTNKACVFGDKNGPIVGACPADQYQFGKCPVSPTPSETNSNSRSTSFSPTRSISRSNSPSVTKSASGSLSSRPSTSSTPNPLRRPPPSLPPLPIRRPARRIKVPGKPPPAKIIRPPPRIQRAPPKRRPPPKRAPRNPNPRRPPMYNKKVFVSSGASSLYPSTFMFLGMAIVALF